MKILEKLKNFWKPPVEVVSLGENPPQRITLPAGLEISRENLSRLRAGQGSIDAIITIRRAATGKEETYNLKLLPHEGGE